MTKESSQHKQLLVGFLEQQMDALVARLACFTGGNGEDALKSLATSWLANQIAFHKGETYRVGEWTAQVVTRFGGTSAGLEEAYGFLRFLRKTLFSACLGHVEGVPDAALADIMLEATDLHEQHMIQHCAQHMREYEGADQRRQRAILEAVTHPLALLNPQGFVDIANRDFGRCLTATPEALQGLDLPAMCDKSTATKLRAALAQKRTAKQIKAFSGSLQFGKKSVEALFQVQPIFDAAGIRTGAIVSLETDAALGEDDMVGVRFVEDHLLKSFPFAIQMLDGEGNVRSNSDEVASLAVAEYDNTEPLCCFLHRRRHEGPRECQCTQVFTEGLFNMEEICCEEGGEVRWYLVVMAPVPDDRGKTARTLVLVYDMTRRRHLQKQLESHIIQQQRSSLVAQIAVTVAHQLRNPLSVVLGFAEMMSKGLPPEQYAEAVSRILRNSIRCKDIVENLLDFGKGMPLERRPVDFETLIRESVRPLLTPSQNRLIEWRFSELAAPVECVPEQLTQVVFSLLDNALRAAESRIVCAVDQKGDMVRLRVVDDGEGIDFDARERIFEPFYTTRRHEGAVGLGLSLARAVASDYGGSLTISAPTGGEPRGACMLLQLPMSKRRGVRSTAQNDLTSDADALLTPSGERSVLLIDDEADLLDLLKTALFMRGFKVDAVSSGPEAIEKMGANTYDAVVVDFLLSGSMNGQDVYEHVVQHHPNLVKRLFFITADTLNYQTRLFLESTRRPVLEKPFLMVDFVSELNKVTR